MNLQRYRLDIDVPCYVHHGIIPHGDNAWQIGQDMYACTGGISEYGQYFSTQHLNLLHPLWCVKQLTIDDKGLTVIRWSDTLILDRLHEQLATMDKMVHYRETPSR